MDWLADGLLANVTLAGKHILVTAGPTHEPIDPVRVIANRSSGKQGFAIAAAAAEAGRAGDADRRAGRARQRPPASTGSMSRPPSRWRTRSMAALPADCAVLVAAVADWRVEPSPTQAQERRTARRSSSSCPTATSSPSWPSARSARAC